MNRRTFIRRSGGTLAAVWASGAIGQRRAPLRAAPNERIVVAVAGVRGRGSGLLRTFAAQGDVDVKYVCDVDQSVLDERSEQVASSTGRSPERIKDFRRALDDPAVDALVLGTPDHWHALPTILACQAGKDVYVEKPDGHNLIEGQVMVAAAGKYDRIVQLGTQMRSAAHMHRAIEYIAAGNLGKPLVARAWESGRQGSIGRPADAAPPAGVDYDLWLGPAPQRPFNPVRFHGNWRWFFDYGTGDLGNDGVHRLDVARWAFDTALVAAGQPPLGWPQRVSAAGGKCYFDDLQEWPDTLQVTWDWGDRLLTYEMRIWVPYRFLGEPEGAAVYGDQGYIVIGNRRWRAYGADDKLLVEETGDYDDGTHVRNFLDSMRSRARPAADLASIGHPSSALCHLGNVAWRTGRTLRFDPQTYTFQGDEEANQYLTRREYRRPWLLPRADAV